VASSRRSPRPGRVAVEKMFEPSVRKRRLILAPDGAPTREAQLTADAGAWLKRLREERGLTQSDIAAAIGVKNKARISQMENGKQHLQPQNFEQFAVAVGVEPPAFVRRLLSYYSPEVYEILFNDPAAGAGSTTLDPS
jgi:ribosome-binding protein aMBF1 (putative translation factor)